MKSEPGKTQAEIDAKVAMLNAQAAKLAAEAAKVEAQAETARQEAITAKAEADTAVIGATKARDRYEAEMAGNEHHHVYEFNSVVNTSSVKECMTKLTEWHRRAPGCAIEIIFNSPGGEIIPGMALFDHILEMRAQGHEVTTVALGYAASMAGILLQAGSKRVAGREAWVLIHEVSSWAQGKVGDMEDEVKFLKRLQKRVLHIFAERSDGKISEQALARKWHKTDWWLDSDECLQLGIVDEIR